MQHTLLTLPNAGPAARGTSWNLGWMQNGPNTWPGARVFSPGMIKSSTERLPTMSMELRTVARGGAREAMTNKRVPPQSPEAIKAG